METHLKYREAYKAIKPYAMVGWLNTEKGYTIKQINDLQPFAIVMLEQEFDKFIKEKIEKENN